MNRRNRYPSTIGNAPTLLAGSSQPHFFRIRSSISLLTWFVILAAILRTGNGQEKQIGVDLCACSPRSFEFKFDFSLVCPPVNIPEGGGIQTVSCLLSPFSNPDTTDLVPVSVSEITAIELGQDVSVLEREEIDKEGILFLDGETFSYSSLIDTPSDVSGANDVPRVLQLNIIGQNQAGEDIINVFIITYSNTCTDFPVLTAGQSVGWVRLVRAGVLDYACQPTFVIPLLILILFFISLAERRGRWRPVALHQCATCCDDCSDRGTSCSDDSSNSGGSCCDD